MVLLFVLCSLFFSRLLAFAASGCYNPCDRSNTTTLEQPDDRHTTTAPDVDRRPIRCHVYFAIGLIISYPLLFSVYTLLYYDLRIRKEGYDLEVLAQQAAQT